MSTQMVFNFISSLSLKLSGFSSSVCAYVCACVDEGAYVPVPAIARGLDVTLDIIPQESSTLYFETGFFTGLEFATGICLCPPPSTRLQVLGIKLRYY